MHHVRKVLAGLLMLTVLFGCAVSASAAGTRPEDSWFESHLLTEVPSDKAEEFSEFIALEHPQITRDGSNYLVTAEPCGELDANTVYHAVVNLVQVTENGKAVWTLDASAPLTAEDPNQERDEAHKLPENDDTLTAPTTDELSDLIRVLGWCGHGRTELELSAVKFDVVTYKDNDGTVRARITFPTANVADAVSASRGSAHSAGSLAKLRVQYQLTPSDEGCELTGIRLRFILGCGATPTHFTVTYSDGLDSAVFAEETYNVKPYTKTPGHRVDVSKPDALRPGYRFLGWSPEIQEKVDYNVTYTAQWVKLYTVTYRDGKDGAIFPEESSIVPDGAATPAFSQADRDSESFYPGYKLTGWNPEIEPSVTGDAVYTAVWTPVSYTITYENVPEGVENSNPTSYTIEDSIELTDLAADGFVCWLDENGQQITKIPAGTTGAIRLSAKMIAKPLQPKIGTNVSEGLLKFQCTTHEEHNWLDSTAFDTYYRNMKWNAETRRWETYVSVRMNMINISTTQKKYFGGIQHYYDKNAVRVDVYFDPDAQGLTATGNPVTGLWYAADGNPAVLDVQCYDEPAAPATVATKLWIRDWTNLSNWERVSAVQNGTYTVSEVYGDRTNGFFVDVTIDDLSAYISSRMAAKTTGTYIVDPVQNSGPITYRMKYTGSVTDLKQDGSGWQIDTSDWSGTDKNNGKTVFVLPQWTTTYTDGADGTAFADKEIAYPATSNDVAQDVLKTGNISTPAFGNDPVRTGYTFLGWEPAVSESLTENKTYTAKWVANPAVPSSSNTASQLYKFHCTVNEAHTDQICSWLTYTSYNRDMAYDAARGVFTATVKISNVPGRLTVGTSSPQTVWGMKHYYTDENGKTLQTALIHVVWDSSANQWVPDGEQVLNVWCATAPTAPVLSLMTPRSMRTSTAIRVLSVDEPFDSKHTVQTDHNRPTYFNQLIAGSYTIGPVTKDENGDFWATLTIDPGPYLAAFNSHNASEPAYHVDTAKTTGSFTYKLKYAGSKINYTQDGSNWTVDSYNKFSPTGLLYVSNKYTVTYTDGVADMEVFADQSTSVVSGSLTPAFSGTPERTGYTFVGWDPEVSETVTGDVTYTAKWRVNEPMTPSGTNSIRELFQFHCTANAAHADQTYNWFGSYVTYNGDMAYDAVRGVYTASANITNVQTLLDFGSNCPNDIWGTTHYHTDEEGSTVRTATIHLVWDPEATGANAGGTTTTGLWLPDGPQSVNVWCATAPAAPKLSGLPSNTKSSTAIRVMSVDEPAGTTATSHNIPIYFKYLTEGTYTISSVTKDADGIFWATLTIDPSAYIAKFNADNSSEPSYRMDFSTTSNFTYKLKYTGSTTDYKQDGSGWSIDKSSYASGETVKTGKIVYVTNKYTVTYTDGVDDAEVFADQTYSVVSGSETPAFAGTPEREGYTFSGWTPEVAATVTADVTYTATWTEKADTGSADPAADAAAPAPVNEAPDTDSGEAAEDAAEPVPVDPEKGAVGSEAPGISDEAETGTNGFDTGDGNQIPPVESDGEDDAAPAANTTAADASPALPDDNDVTPEMEGE